MAQDLVSSYTMKLIGQMLASCYACFIRKVKLGMLGLSIPSIYGEGEKAAFDRLSREIRINQPTRDPRLEVSIGRCLADLRISDAQDDKSRMEETKGGLSAA